MTLTRRLTKGSQLTAAEHDGNVDEIESRLPTNNAQPTGTFYPQGVLREKVAVVNSGSAYTVDPAANGAVVSLTLTANCTLTFPTNANGLSFTLRVKQDATGGRTLTLPSSVRWAGSVTPTPTTTAGRTDVYMFEGDGTYWLGYDGGRNWTLS